MAHVADVQSTPFEPRGDGGGAAIGGVDVIGIDELLVEAEHCRLARADSIVRGPFVCARKGSAKLAPRKLGAVGAVRTVAVKDAKQDVLRGHWAVAHDAVRVLARLVQVVRVVAALRDARIAQGEAGGA